jgi:hypothetical protein
METDGDKNIFPMLFKGCPNEDFGLVEEFDSTSGRIGVAIGEFLLKGGTVDLHGAIMKFGFSCKPNRALIVAVLN